MRLVRIRKSIPDSPELAFVNAVLETEKGNSKLAVTLLEKALTAEPDNIDYLRQFVIVAIRAGQPAAGARAAERLMALRPDELEYVYLYGAAALQANSLAKAEASLVRYTIARPADSRGCLALGLTYAAQAEKLDLGRRQMEQCLIINPRNFEAAYQLGLFYKTLGEIAKSQEYLELTISISPDYGAALRDLGSVYLQSGAEAKARPVLEKAVRLLPNDAETHFQLSRLYNVLGERELGRKHLEIFQSLRTPKKDGME
jgi:tetratricopeptide (TPR) repeat protein